MNPDVFGELVNAAIPFLGGIYATLLGYRVVGTKPGTSIRADEWHTRFDRMFRILGPLLMLFGLSLCWFAIQ